MRVDHLLASGAFVLAAASFTPAFAQAPEPPHCGGTTLTSNLYRFCYDGKQWQVDEPSNVRFTSRDRVEVEVMHLNYFRYTLSFDVQEQKSEAYQYLTKLWTSVIGIGFGSFTADLSGTPLPAGATDDERRKRTAQDAFIRHLRDLLRYAEALDTRITRAIGRHQRPGLDSVERTALSSNLGDKDSHKPCDAKWEPTKEDSLLSCAVLDLARETTARFYALEQGVHMDNDQFLLSTGDFGEVYEKAKALYAGVRERADLFAVLATRSLGSETRKVGKRDAGVRVTIHLAAVDPAGRSAIGDVSYFVETTLPLVVHGGMAFSRLNDVTFEKVKRASAFSEEDLFQKTGDDANSRNVSLYMGWRVTNLDGRQPNTSRFALLVSLGTDVDAPGKKIYVGPTLLLFNRFAVTYGAALGKEKDGEQVTLEPDVFRIIKAKPSSAQFFSITTKVF
jgi:hypothetical protein